MGTKPTDRSVYPDGTPTACVVIVNSEKNDGIMHVHDAECGDKRRYRVQEDWAYTVEVRDKRDVVDDTYGPGAGSYYVESGYEGTEEERNETAWREYLGEFRFFPCVDLPEDIGGLRHTEEPEPMLLSLIEEHTVTVNIPTPPEGAGIVRVHLEGEAKRNREMAERSDLPEGFRANLVTMAEYYENYAAWIDQVQHSVWEVQG